MHPTVWKGLYSLQTHGHLQVTLWLMLEACGALWLAKRVHFVECTIAVDMLYGGCHILGQEPLDTEFYSLPCSWFGKPVVSLLNTVWFAKSFSI